MINYNLISERKDDEISKSKAKSKEIDDFTKELQNALTKDNSKINSLYNEFLKEIPLASKYKNKISDIIKDGLDTLLTVIYIL